MMNCPPLLLEPGAPDSRRLCVVGVSVFGHLLADWGGWGGRISGPPSAPSW